ncbi:MAG: hypothetical protein ACP5JG_10915 [Anaerolineae bacterium]
MECPACGKPLEGASVVCPHCGTTLIEEDASSSDRRRRVWLRILIVLLGISLFAGVVAGAAYYGIYVGERDREARRDAVIEEHYQAGVTALNDGRFERAVAEFKYVLELDPDHVLAKQQLAEAQTRLEVKPTPTLEVAQSLAEQLLQQAQASHDQEDWVATARTLTQLRALDPDYEQEAVEEMLFDSLYNAGIAYLDQEQLEAGISYLDQAIALRPLDANVVSRRSLAARYLDALNYWGVDWELAIARFEELYATAPDYKDVAERLRLAHVEYGDVFAERGEMCPAEMQYSQALRMYASATVEDKRAQAAQICLVATPVPVSGTMPVLTPRPIAGFTVGRLAYPIYDGTTGSYSLNALYADGRIIRVAALGDQPWWEWGTGRLAYRDKSTGALSMMLPEEGVPLQLLPAGLQAWPTLSPDNQRFAYAEPDAEGTWTIFVANVDGSGEPRQLGTGWAPAWGRSGLLAYTGCDIDGRCGIFLDNPDDDQPAGRLTASGSDTAVSWAPGGNMMAYMGDINGSWDILLLSPEGGVQELVVSPANEGLPAWSPDGNSLAFVSDRDGDWAVYVMQLGSRQIERILVLGSALPSWENQRLHWAP